MLRLCAFVLVLLALVPRLAAAVTVEDVLFQPVKVSSDALAGRMADKFVYYEKDGFFVPTRFLIETDIKACIDPNRATCTTQYLSKPEVQKAATIYFGFPLFSGDDVVRTSLRTHLGNDLITVTSTWTAGHDGLLLKMAVVRKPANGGSEKASTHWARFSPNSAYAGLRIKFHENISARPWTESLSRVRRDSLRNVAGAAIRINNHFQASGSGKYQVRHGSGFFYKSRNRIMTAWHNLRANNDCRLRKRCKLYFLHTDPRGVKRKFSQTVTVETYSAKDDFAIIRLQTPGNIPAKVLRVAARWIGPEVSILGYPAPAFNLLYSHGYLNGMTRGTRRLVASAHVVGGYSGAPVVDLKSSEILGFARAWQRPKGQPGKGGPVSLNLIRVLEREHGL